MQITSDMVRELREKTGAGMMDCKRALTDSGGDMEAAVDILRTKGLAAAAKKASRIASEGVVAAHVGTGSAALLEINCETDFVAKTGEFQAFAQKMAAFVNQAAPGDVEEAMALPVEGGGTLADAMTGQVAKIGEKISLRRFVRFALSGKETGLHVPYIHAGGKIGVLVELVGAGPDTPGIAALAKDLAMQVAAANPTHVTREEVPPEAIQRELSIYREQALAAGKPEKILDRIATGKLEKFFGDSCLVEQAFIKDPDRKVRDLLREAGSRAGGELRVSRFARFHVGEGLEKRTDDLAAEVAKQLGRG